MVVRIIFYIVISYFLMEFVTNNNLELPDYEYYSDRHTVEKPSLREVFLERKIRNRVKKTRMNLLNKYLSENTVYLNGVPHVKVNEGDSSWNKINQIELGIKSILAAVGVSYVYKRDHYWRTWKRVIYPNGITNIVCYRCNNIINATCKKCPGFWSIEEESPPCPLELFSVKSPTHVCAANYSNIYNYTDACPTVINFADVMSSCDNPITTKYRITRLFKESKGLPSVICGKFDYCEISTFYRIYKDFILFRIIDSNNDIIYSRIMKYGDNNYACVKNCGRTKSNNDTDDKPLSISLLSNRVKKRESKLHKLSSYNTTPKTFRQTKKNMPIKKTAGKKKMETKNFSESMTILSHSESLKKTILSLQETLEKIKSKYFVSAVTESTCSKLGKQATKEDSEENDVE